MRARDRETGLRLKRFHMEERRRQLGQIETMMEEFGRMVSDLDHEVAAEHRRTGIDDEKHFAYSTYAKAASQRRNNLQASVADLESQREAAQAALAEALSDLRQEEERLERETALLEAERATG